MTVPAFALVAADPMLIPGIYDACDQWCMYCRVTSRCLAYRCTPNPQAAKQSIYRNLAERLHEGMIFLKRVCEAEGRPTPEIDAMLSGRLDQMPLVAVDDALERMGRRYAQLSDTYLLSRPDFPFEMRPRPSGPTPFEVFAWFHRLVPAKVYRALVSAARAARGDTGCRQDALASAKVALIGIDRSLDALAEMTREDDDPRLELLQRHLRRLHREVEARFPEARRFVRRGLDDGPADPDRPGTNER
jgi:hypothetical protein